MSIPAQRITTNLEWDDLVLPEGTLNQIMELQSWIEQSGNWILDEGIEKRIEPGCRALFCGAPGTGKTLTACLLGKSTGLDVFKVDLSRVVSKYIGETEKNLADLFDRAEQQGWILFFDEAEALFGKRTKVRDAHDRYANQEVSYLLQRLEDYGGIAIASCNRKSNIDRAFMRRLQVIVHFPMPETKERLRIWEKAFPAAVTLDEEVNLDIIARMHEITGGTIMKVARHCHLQAKARGDHVIREADIDTTIRREQGKEAS